MGGGEEVEGEAAHTGSEGGAGDCGGREQVRAEHVAARLQPRQEGAEEEAIRGWLARQRGGQVGVPRHAAHVEARFDEQTQQGKGGLASEANRQTLRCATPTRTARRAACGDEALQAGAVGVCCCLSLHQPSLGPMWCACVLRAVQCGGG